MPDKPERAGGLEALQRHLIAYSKEPHFDVPSLEATHKCAEVWADALAPHISAAKEREEKLWTLVERMRVNALAPHKNCTNGWAKELAAILGERGA